MTTQSAPPPPSPLSPLSIKEHLTWPIYLNRKAKDETFKLSYSYMQTHESVHNINKQSSRGFGKHLSLMVPLVHLLSSLFLQVPNFSLESSQ